ncbi:MAG: DUF3794 domain-containing protein [Clostridia bacterium]|nr:DUF3794 domain-containing protein [Clostridia bacterium]
MDLILAKNEYRSVQVVFDSYAVTEESGDAIVPDYCPDMIRIAETSAELELTGKEIRGGRVFAEGLVHAGAIYVPETDFGIFSIPVTIPVTQTFDISALNEDKIEQVSVSAEIVSVSARELNPRKVSVKATVSFRCTVYSSDVITLSTDIADAELYGVEYKKEPVYGQYMTFCNEKMLSISDSSELNDFRPGELEILKLSSTPEITDCKLITDKIVLKGEMSVSMLVRTGDQTRPVASAETVFPFSGVIDCRGVRPESKIKQYCRILSSKYKITEEAGTGKALLVMSADISVFTEVWEALEAEIIVDAYAVKNNYELKSIPLSLSGGNEEITLKEQIKESISAGVGIRSVYSCSVNAANPSTQREDGRTNACCDAKLKIIFEADDGGIYSLSKNIPVCCAIDTDTEVRAVYAKAVDDSFHISGNEDIELRFSVEFVIEHGGILSLTQVDSIVLGESSGGIRTPALTLCYADPDEKVWDMAKRLRAAAADIVRANGLADDCLPQGRLLLVPRGGRK